MDEEVTPEEENAFNDERRLIENEVMMRAELRAALATQLQQKLPKSRPQTVKPPNPEINEKMKTVKAALRASRTNDPQNPMVVHNYNLHRSRVQTAKPVVDTSSPIVARNTYTQPTAFNRRLANFARIERENAIMLRRVAEIISGEPYVDNKLQPAKIARPVTKSKRTRQMNLLTTTFSNLNLLRRIQRVKPMIETRALLVEYKKKEAIMQRLSVYPLFWKTKPLKGWEDHIERANNWKPSVRCFLQLGTETEILGQITIQLNYEVTPMTCENFRCLCTGEFGLSYKCSQIHRIIPGILWQGGDVTGQDGFGSKSIYGDTFPDENFILKHDLPGTISMANCGPNSNGSQFIITARSAPALDGINVVFGKVVAGMDVLNRLYDYLGSTGVPKCDIFITDCAMISPSSSSSIHETEEKSPEEVKVAESDDDDVVYPLTESKSATLISGNMNDESDLPLDRNVTAPEAVNDVNASAPEDESDVIGSAAEDQSNVNSSAVEDESDAEATV